MDDGAGAAAARGRLALTSSGPAGAVVAVLVPCRNEAGPVGKVVADFRRELPGATVYVYDNGSTDATAQVARAAGAVVRAEPRPGKGGVIRRMLGEIDADVYVIVDGDATYDAASVRRMIGELAANDLDMVTAVRDEQGERRAYRRGHRIGNHAFNALLGMLFGARPADMLSGYRVLSRRFAKSFPAISRGFEIETELVIHALEQRLPTAEVPTPYLGRPAGSASKLSTFADGGRILWITVMLFRDEKPLAFFGGIALGIAAAGLLLGGSVIVEYMETHLVPRLPTAILATSLMLLAFLALGCGLILNNVARGRREAKRLAYLMQSALAAHPGSANRPAAPAPSRARREPAERERGG
jgi:glycosyltransferase involved in cell wall biosynthesis